MSSLRFPFSFPRLPHFPFSAPPPASSAAAAAALTAAAAAVGLSLAVSLNSDGKHNSSLENTRYGLSPLAWASLSLAGAGTASSTVEPKTGAEFPAVVDGGRKLAGVGLRRTNVLGLKTIDVYAFGVYVDDSDMSKLKEKYGTASVSEIKEHKEFITDALESDIRMTIRLQIVYGRLSIRSVRNAFQKSVGSRLQKFGGPDTNELLQSFVSLFKDEQKLPKGSLIELSREEGFVLKTRIDGKEVGSIPSKLLCKSILDLYFGEDPFDKRAKDEIQLNLATILKASG